MVDWLIILIVGAIIDQIARAAKRSANRNAQQPGTRPVGRDRPYTGLPASGTMSALPQQPVQMPAPAPSSVTLYSQERPLAGPPRTVSQNRLVTEDEGRRRLEALTPIQAKAAGMRGGRQLSPDADMSSVAADFAEQRRLMDVEFSAAADEARLQTDGSIEDLNQTALSRSRARGRRFSGSDQPAQQEDFLTPRSMMGAIILSQLLSKPRCRRK